MQLTSETQEYNASDSHFEVYLLKLKDLIGYKIKNLILDFSIMNPFDFFFKGKMVIFERIELEWINIQNWLNLNFEIIFHKKEDK
jgi:hypothetical protein